MGRSKKNKVRASVSFDPDVMEYVDAASKRLDHDRSWVINAMLREYIQMLDQEQQEPKLFSPLRERITET